MLDQRTSLLLARIDELCGAGGYKIAEEGELLAAFPEGERPDGAELRRLLGYLCEHAFIDMRYAEEGMYCVCPLPDGRLYFEQERSEQARARRSRREGLLFSALGGLAGGLFGGFLAALLRIAFSSGGV